MRFGIIGSGSWATALAKILTDNKHTIHWLLRNEKTQQHLEKRGNNPSYLSSVYFNREYLNLSLNVVEVVEKSDIIIVAVPSAFVIDTLEPLARTAFVNKKFVSAVKGIIPQHNVLLNECMLQQYEVSADNYFTIMGPCHAEEVASEKLSYLTISGNNINQAAEIAEYFATPYLNTITNNDIYGVQYAAVLKNIYALGAGIAHGLEYGDNFLSVLIANSADEMAGFLRKVGIQHIEVGVHDEEDHRKSPNYAASVYLGDLLVTCYSPYSRNRSFGTMIGKGYSVKTAQLELNMVAEGYNASKCMAVIFKSIDYQMPIANAIYQILWENVKPAIGMKQIEEVLV